MQVGLVGEIKLNIVNFVGNFKMHIGVRTRVNKAR